MNGFNRLNGKSVKARLWEVSVLGTLRSFFLRGRGNCEFTGSSRTGKDWRELCVGAEG